MRGGLVWKYAVLFVVLVGGALVASSAIELYFSYQENKAALVALQKEKAQTAAVQIEAFVREIERQTEWVTQPQLVAPAAALEQRRLDYARLERQVRAITEISYLDAAGREQIRMSRVAPNVFGSQADFSGEPKFREAQRGTWFGPVYFRKESEPYMTIAMPHPRGGGVTAVEVNLKFIWDVVSQIRIGKAGRAYVVDAAGTLIAHPDISLVLQKTSLASLDQVRAAVALQGPGSVTTEVSIARNREGRRVLSAWAPIPALRWTVLAEQPLEEAFEPLRASIQRTLAMLGIGVALSIVASAMLARRMVRPIRALQEGAARIGAGELGQRLAVRTGDELGALAGEFNRMTEQLQDSYATLERRVEERTHELSRALEQQTATSEILRVISSSPTDARPVFDVIADSALRLLHGFSVIVTRIDGPRAYAAAIRGGAPGSEAAVRELVETLPPARGTYLWDAILDRDVKQIADVEAEDVDPAIRAGARARGWRANLAVPMLQDGRPIGLISVSRQQPGAFAPHEVRLLQTFADQAVIAVQNVGLFSELQNKNRALSEALEQQTATADILGVISSSPTDVQPVLDAVAESAARLCGAADALVMRVEGDTLRRVAHFGTITSVSAARAVTLDTPTGRAVLERRTIHVEDIVVELAAGNYPEARALHDATGFRTLLSVPLVREDAVVGVITIRRLEARPFADEQIALVKTFADQAVIAIENVRLFTELQEKNRAVTEALEQQTATADILAVISSSPTDVQPVFEAIVESGLKLFPGAAISIALPDGDRVRAAAVAESDPERAVAWRSRFPFPLTREYMHAVTILDRRVVDIPDVAQAPPEWTAGRQNFLASGYRAVTIMPMIRGEEAIGALSVVRVAPGPLSEKQVAVLKTFADQAVIAIENVRLFTALRERTRELARSVEQLTALGEVSRAVGSTLDLDRVLSTVVSRAGGLADADGCSIYEYDDAADGFRVRAAQQTGDELLETQREVVLRRGEGAVGRVATTRESVQIPDIAAEPAYRSPLRDALLRGGYRAVLAVPMVHEDRVVGALVVSRKLPGEFPAETVELLKTFATQSALAIQNARLFREIQQKSAELEVANRHKSEFLASMSHELRTPLNAVIGFSEVLLERMFGELNDKQDEYLRDIYSSGRHLLSLINDILDLAKIEAGRMELDVTRFDLPQAIENAVTLVRGRASAHGIRLETQVDPRLGDFAGDERKVKQILLNLLSNAVKFTAEGGRITLRAAPANGSVEMSVIDTGIGIAPEDQAAVFEEFRQVGTDYARKREGTGLGLALTKRFVELHGGTIWLKSALGEGSTFTFTLPVR